ncbi:uncharacterized protein LOC123686556 [Harmonia axyridis]|uniref:uncharacterized protein LOC123686556 n=1 Tax=Harmonia axyridis TaxID=115357 RepID=UPI001E2799C1|nr:uncharacterized protein LOC123686556 [Harmonia axyridis]
MAWANALKLNVDLMVVSEPNKKICSSGEWITDEEKDIAVKIINKQVKVHKVNKRKNYVHLMLDGVQVYAIYVSPNIPIQIFKNRIDEVMEDVAIQSGGIIVMGDFNAKSPIWGTPKADIRGEYVEEWLAQTSFTAINNGEPTFIRGTTRSHIDVTLSPINFQGKIKNWEVKYENPFTYHGHIYFAVESNTRVKR